MQEGFPSASVSKMVHFVWILLLIVTMEPKIFSRRLALFLITYALPAQYFVLPEGL